MLTDHSGIDTVISALGRLAIAAQIPLVRLAASSPSVRWSSSYSSKDVLTTPKGRSKFLNLPGIVYSKMSKTMKLMVCKRNWATKCVDIFNI